MTLELVSTLLVRLVMRGGESCLSDEGLALLEGAREENILLLQNYFKMDEMFLEVFEDEYLDLVEKKRLSMEHLLMDPSLLLPPVGSPLSGVPFDKRLPCGEVGFMHTHLRSKIIFPSLKTFDRCISLASFRWRGVVVPFVSTFSLGSYLFSSAKKRKNTCHLPILKTVLELRRH